MTLTELRDKADTVLAQFWTALRTRQNAYYAKHGKYFQLLISPTDMVVGGVDTDYAVRHPSSERYIDDVSFAFTSKVPFQIRIDEWVGPQGNGYSATVWVQLPNGNMYTRTRDNSNHDSGWSKYEIIIPILYGVY